MVTTVSSMSLVSGRPSKEALESGDGGKFHLSATVPTAKGVRGVVAGKGETAYLIDPAEGRILKLTHK